MAEELKSSEISKFYDGKNVFITGATGFMGKVLVEKLLRDCSGLNEIIILIRNKRGMNLEKRCSDFINHMVFDNLRKNCPDVLSKVKAVSGDVSADGLEMSKTDSAMLIDEINILFHCAANVRFDQTLRDAVNFNTLGTLRVLKLAEKMKKLEVFLHVSTSYCHCNESVLEERYYEAIENPFGVIDMVEALKDETLDTITPKLLNGLPNTYAFTKGLTEDLVHSYMDKFPIAIARPSIVTAAWKYPYEGWIEGLNGPTGLTLGAAKGVIRTMFCNPDYRSQAIPVDIVINAMIAMAFQRSKMPAGSEYYCNLTDYTKNPLTWGETIKYGKEMVRKYPLSQMLWYPGGTIKSNFYHHLICSIFFHYLPAYFLDFMLIIFRQKPFMVRVQKKVSLGQKVLQYYTTRDWIFKCDNYLKLLEDMNVEDRKIFYCDLEELDFGTYMEKYIIGIRQYIVKESADSLPKARRTLKILFFLDRTLNVFLIMMVAYFIWTLLAKLF